MSWPRAVRPVVEAQQILGRRDRRHGTDLGDLAAAGRRGALGPSVKSQTLPATSAINDVVVSYRTVAGFQPSGPTAVFASASVGKFSTRQYSGPGGNCLIFFSATGLTTNFCCAAAGDGDNSNPIAQSDRAKAMTRGAGFAVSSIVLPWSMVLSTDASHEPASPSKLESGCSNERSRRKRRKTPKFEEAERLSLRYDTIGAQATRPRWRPDAPDTRNSPCAVSLGEMSLASFCWRRRSNCVPRSRRTLPEKAPLAIKGYDPVAYFTWDARCAGCRKSNMNGTSTATASRSAEHRELFKADPVRYAPQFANFCAMALTRGEVDRGQPGKLADQRRQALYLRQADRAGIVSAGLPETSSRRTRTARSFKKTSGHLPTADGRLGDVEAGLAQAVAQVFEIGRVQKLGAEVLRVEGRVDAADHASRPERRPRPVLLGIGGRQHDAAEVRAGGFAKIELRLFDRRVIAPLSDSRRD